MSHQSDGEECVICRYNEEKKEIDDSTFVEVRQKGVETLKTYCRKHKAFLLLDHLKDCEKDARKVKVHSKCRRDFTDPKRVKKDTVTSSVTKKLTRSECGGFNWKLNCFFCAKIDSRHVGRENIIAARTLQLRNSILIQCDNRNDQWSEDVKGRLQDCIDFVAAEAVYHKKCYSRFMNIACSITASSSGRPVNSGAAEIFDKLCYWLENECEMEVLTLDEVHDKMKSMSDEHEPYSRKWLKTKLQQRFGDHLVFSEVCGKKNALSFKDMVNYIINKKWYEERNNDSEQEAMRIITTAAKLIRQEIQNIDIDTEYYPTTQGIKESTQQNQWCSPLLRMFLSSINWTMHNKSSSCTYCYSSTVIWNWSRG